MAAETRRTCCKFEVPQVNLSPDSYLYRMNDVSRELYIVGGGMVELLIEQDDQPDHTESTRRAGQVSSDICFNSTDMLTLPLPLS